MIALPRRNNRQQKRITEQTLKDRFEIARRISGRELELARLSVRIASIIPSQKRKETLVKLANERAVEFGQPFLPRLVARHLSLIILWFADNCPDMFSCTSITEFFPPSFDSCAGERAFQREEFNLGDDCPFDEPGLESTQDDEPILGWFTRERAISNHQE
jgi:hypothetical protein